MRTIARTVVTAAFIGLVSHGVANAAPQYEYHWKEAGSRERCITEHTASRYLAGTTSDSYTTSLRLRIAHSRSSQGTLRVANDTAIFERSVVVA